jgi:hypothetical protein
MPFTAVAEMPAMYAVFEAIRREAETAAVTVVPGHDPAVLTRFPLCVALPPNGGVIIDPRRESRLTAR